MYCDENLTFLITTKICIGFKSYIFAPLDSSICSLISMLKSKTFIMLISLVTKLLILSLHFNKLSFFHQLFFQLLNKYFFCVCCWNTFMCSGVSLHFLLLNYKKKLDGMQPKHNIYLFFFFFFFSYFIT